MRDGHKDTASPPSQSSHYPAAVSREAQDEAPARVNVVADQVELRPLRAPARLATPMTSRSSSPAFAASAPSQRENGASHYTSPAGSPLHHAAQTVGVGSRSGSVFADPRAAGAAAHDTVVVADGDPFLSEKAAAGADAAVLSARSSATNPRNHPFTPLSRPAHGGFDDAKSNASEHSFRGPAAARSTAGSQPRTPLTAGHHHHNNNSTNGSHARGSRNASLRYSESFVNQSYVKELPAHLMPLAHEIHHLEEEDLVYIADVAHTMANRDLYSLLPYTGSNWFLPSIRECGDGERHWELRYSWKEGLIVAIGGRRLSIRALNIFIRVCFLVLIWFTLWNMLPRWLVEPGGYVWDPAVLVVVSAIVGGLICRILQLPPLVGVLWVGIMWNNIPTLKYLTHGIVKEVYDICSKLGLTVILARAGYKLAIKDIIPHWKQTALLATMPFAFEGVAHSLIANKIFDYDNNYNWAFLQGMLCSIVSPAVVVPGSLYLQDLGYGRGVGPLSLMLSAVGIEIVIGVWCANFIIGLIFYDQQLAVSIVLGPVQFIGGTLIGIALGVLFFYVVELIKQEAHRLPNGKYTRAHLNSCMDFSFFIFLFGCYAMVFFGYKMSLAGGGCVMCVFFSATVAHMWSRTGKVEHEDHKKYVATWLALTWDQAMMPILFATMGAKIDVKSIFNGYFFPKAIICMVCSTAVRLIVIFVIQIGSGMPWKEKLLVCVGYLGKASAQASVGPIAANLVAGMVAALPPSEKHSLDTMAKYANNVQQISAMYVMFMAVVASLGLVRGGTLVLKREVADEKPSGHGVGGSTDSGPAIITTAVALEEKQSKAGRTNLPDDTNEDRQPHRGSASTSPAMPPISHANGHHVSFSLASPGDEDDDGNEAAGRNSARARRGKRSSTIA
ncbi:sodium/hydrogen exchanger [Novymonas esmeraldas]|uniref:Sodium/hydrogen exchanger n=1 Tax=Novymonas esmeraldas TaxID=1808958 RepID=A0AAW0F514_9TRYP